MYARGIGASRKRRPYFSSVMKTGAGDLLFARFIPDDDLHDAFVKFSPGIFPGYFEFVGTGRFGIHDVEILIHLGSHQSFTLKPIRVQRMPSTSPCLGGGLRVVCVRGKRRTNL
jgi:hypothetical protein